MVQKMLVKFPYIGKKLQALDNCGYLPGHYYSPIPNLEEIRKRRIKIFSKASIDVKGIDLRKEEQFKMLQLFAAYYREIPYNFLNTKRGIS